MKITYIDTKAAHGEGNSCPANRYIPHPNGGWTCLDCGIQMLLVTVDVEPRIERPAPRKERPRGLLGRLGR